VKQVMTRYEIHMRHTDNGHTTRLHEASDPNAATIAFHAELRRQSERGARGELLLFKQREDSRLILRQPVR
jgi:hypothetical protein